MGNQLLVISLKRTPERLKAFFAMNKHALIDWEVDVIHGIDGIQQEEIIQRSRWVSASAMEHWTQGAIGSALSHVMAWRRCIEMNQEVLIAEDDVILANDLRRKLEELKIWGNNRNNCGLALLGWNLDSVLHAELTPGLEMIGLFEPIYPKQKQIKEIINNGRDRNLCKLKMCFGLPAYRINPQIAQELIQTCRPLKVEENKMTRGIPEHILVTLDGILCNRYKDINAKVTIPPLALSLNDQQTSLTRGKKIHSFDS